MTRRRHPTGVVVTIALLCTLAPSCGAPPSPAVTPSSGGEDTPHEITSRFRLVGVVVEVDQAAPALTVRHEAIPGYMRAMTMALPVENRSDLDDVLPGDEIEATLTVTDDRSALRDVVVTRPAEPGAEQDRSANPNPVLTPGELVPDFEVTTQEGRRLRLSELRGRAVALTFVYTRCPLPDFCPLTDRKFGELARLVRNAGRRGAEVVLLSVSFDPDHDTPDVLRRHARAVGAAPPWSFAVATYEALRTSGPALGLAYGPNRGEIIHSLSTSIIAPDGTLVRLERDNRWSPPELARELLAAQRASRPNLDGSK